MSAPKRPRELLSATWTRFDVPGTYVSAEFPAKPVSETEDQGDEITTTLYLERHEADGAFRFDLAVTSGRPRELPTSERLAEQLHAGLSEDPAFEVLSVTPKPYGPVPGALQKMRLLETGEILTQWIICERERTIFAGVTVMQDGFEELGARFVSSVSTTRDTK